MRGLNRNTTRRLSIMISLPSHCGGPGKKKYINWSPPTMRRWRVGGKDLISTIKRINHNCIYRTYCLFKSIQLDTFRRTKICKEIPHKTYIRKKFTAKKNWLSGDITALLESPPIPLIKLESTVTKKYLDCTKVNLFSNTTSGMSESYKKSWNCLITVNQNNSFSSFVISRKLLN